MIVLMSVLFVLTGWAWWIWTPWCWWRARKNGDLSNFCHPL